MGHRLQHPTSLTFLQGSMFDNGAMLAVTEGNQVYFTKFPEHVCKYYCLITPLWNLKSFDLDDVSAISTTTFCAQLLLWWVV